MSSAADRLRRVGPVRLGLLLAFGAAVGSAAGIIPYKQATERADADEVVVALLVSAALLNTAGSLLGAARGRKGADGGGGSVEPPVDSAGGLAELDVETADPLHTARPVTESDRSGLRPVGRSTGLTIGVGILLGVLAAVANWTASEAVSRLDASVASLLIQMQVLFAALLARLWLGERVGRRFLVGAVVALAGLALMQGLGDGRDAGISVAAWGLAAAACFGSMQVVTRRWIERFSPVVVNALRLWIAAAVVALVPGAFAGATALSAEVIALAAAAAFCGPFLGRLMMMQSAHYIPAAASTLVGLSSPVLALLAGWVVLDELPTAPQVVGGAVVVTGMFVAVAGRARTHGDQGRRVRPDTPAEDQAGTGSPPRGS